MKQYISAAFTGALVLVAACQDNTTAPSRDRVVAGSQQTLQSLATGVIANDRFAVAGAYFVNGNIMARNVVVPNGNDTRILSEYYETVPDPSDFVGGVQWANYYITIRAAHNLLHDASLTSLGAGPKAAASGFLRTLIALEYIRVIEYHDQNGVVIQGDDPTKVDPIRTKQSGLAYTSALLDSALTDLNAAASAGTTSLPFVVPPGYQLHGDYASVANLILLNRGLKGKAEVFRALDAANPNAASAATAVTALNAALADAPATPTQDYLNKGIYLSYNPNSPESFGNPLPSATNRLTDNFVNSIQSGDARKANIVPATRLTVRDSAYTGAFINPITDPTNAANQSKPLPVVRNAEFYLLRAQAEIALGNLAAATADINVVHTVEGGLPAYGTFATADDAIAAVLYEYRYSFIYQGPQHVDALREYSMLNQAYVSQPGIPTPKSGNDALVQELPIPQNESNARNGNVTPVP